jgi:hypothetical protein
MPRQQEAASHNQPRKSVDRTSRRAIPAHLGANVFLFQTID